MLLMLALIACKPELLAKLGEKSLWFLVTYADFALTRRSAQMLLDLEYRVTSLVGLNTTALSASPPDYPPPTPTTSHLLAATTGHSVVVASITWLSHDGLRHGNEVWLGWSLSDLSAFSGCLEVTKIMIHVRLDNWQ